MKKIASLEEYQALIKSARKEKKAVVTNCFLFPGAVERLISLGRFGYVDAQDAGIVFLSDEDGYYLAYYYLNTEQPLTLPKGAKPIVAQVLRSGETKTAKQSAADERLKMAGFRLADTMRQLRAEPEQVLGRIGRVCRAAGKALDADGFRFAALGEDMIPEVTKLLKETPEIPPYQLPFFSPEELNSQARSEQLTGILDRDGHLCAAHQFFPEGRNLYGWLAIREPYKNLYGMGLIFTEHVMRYAVRNDYKIAGWIDLKNTPSIQYHTRIGYQFTDRYMDEWILDTDRA